jgi:K(+)-stimulated pyrophosphate-energized sodium pump
MNPVIKFTTLFGLLATEIAVTMMEHEAKSRGSPAMRYIIGGALFVAALIFVWRSFYGMRIPDESAQK